MWELGNSIIERHGLWELSQWKTLFMILELIESVRKQSKHFTWPLNISNDEYGAAFIYGNEEIMGGSRIGVTTGED